MKIAVLGYYGFRNTGDEALCLAIGQELKRLGHTPTILSGDPAYTSAQYGLQSASRMPPGLLGALLNTERLLVGGGGLLQDKTSSRSLQYYLYIIRLARFLHRPVVIFNQSIGPLSAQGAQSTRQALQGLPIVVRDTQSKKALHDLGLNAQLGGDPALLLEAPEGALRDPNHVLVSVRGGYPEATLRLASLAERLVQRGKRITALSFMPGEDSQELEQLRGIAGVTCEETDSPNRALRLIAESGQVIGVRLHALILAAAVGTPFVGINYDPKIAGFCTDAGAAFLPLQFDVDAALAALDTHPNWNAIHAMKDRARNSFLDALK